jgi:hypothetical protein
MLLVTAIWIISSMANAQEITFPKTMSVCDVLQALTKYNGKAIAVRGTYSPWEHGLNLRGEECEGTLVSQGFKWPSIISIALGQKEVESHGRDVRNVVKTTDELSAAIKRELQRRGPSAKVARVKVTYVGLFETHNDLDSRPGDGFGPLNAAPGQLYVDSIRDIVVEFEESTRK